MDLTNKVITIESLSVNSYPPESTAKVQVTQEIAPNVFKEIGTYNLKFEVVFTGFDDPGLMALINQVLTGIPD